MTTPISNERLAKFIRDAGLKKFAFAARALEIANELQSLRSNPSCGGVKKLEWTQTAGPYSYKSGIWKEYRTSNGAIDYLIREKAHNPEPWQGGRVMPFHDTYFVLVGFEKIHHPTLEEAKAAAQADFNTRIRSALASPITEKVAEGWQPIETAPKDGTVLFAVTIEAQNPSARISWWDGDGWVRMWKPEKFVIPGPARWWPTHWMPMPAAPSSEGKP